MTRSPLPFSDTGPGEPFGGRCRCLSMQAATPVSVEGRRASAVPAREWRFAALPWPGRILRKCRDDLLAEESDGFLDQLGSQMAKPVLGAEHIVADQGMLLLDLPDHRIGAADQRQAVVDPEIIGLRPLAEYPTQLKTLWSTRLPSISAIRPWRHAALRRHLASGAAEFGVRRTRGGEMGGGFFPGLFV